MRVTIRPDIKRVDLFCDEIIGVGWTTFGFVSGARDLVDAGWQIYYFPADKAGDKAVEVGDGAELISLVRKALAPTPPAPPLSAVVVHGDDGSLTIKIGPRGEADQCAKR